MYAAEVKSFLTLCPCEKIKPCITEARYYCSAVKVYNFSVQAAHFVVNRHDSAMFERNI